MNTYRCRFTLQQVASYFPQRPYSKNGQQLRFRRMTLFRMVWKATLCRAASMQSLFTTAPRARRRRLCGIYSERGFLIQGTNWTTGSISKYCPTAMTRSISMHTKKSGFLSGDSVRNNRVAHSSLTLQINVSETHLFQGDERRVRKGKRAVPMLQQYV